MIDLDKIEALARAATPGPWHLLFVESDDSAYPSDGCHVYADNKKPLITDDDAPGESDSIYIAAANPAAVLKLVALARQAPGAGMAAIPVATGEQLVQAFPVARESNSPEFDGIKTDMQQGGGKLPQDERAAFEAWATWANYPIFKYTDGSYSNDGTANAFGSWLARAALAQRAARVPAQPLKYLVRWSFAGDSEPYDTIFDNQFLADELKTLRESQGHDSVKVIPLFDVPAASVRAFQQRVQPWMLACFGAEISADKGERNHRFFEESTELVQACGMSASEAHQLVDYVYGRPVGEPAQEVGGVMVTLAALCLAQGMDMHAAGETELERIWTKVETIRAKQAAKPKHSPLPQAVKPDIARDAALEEAASALENLCYGAENGGGGTVAERLRQAQRIIRALATQAAPEVASVPGPGDEPFMYAIMAPDGSAYYEERCVAPTPDALYSAVNALNDSTDTGYRVVPLYARSQPAPVVLLEQAAQACDQQADGTNDPCRAACLQSATAMRELRDATVEAEASTPTRQETPP